MWKSRTQSSRLSYLIQHPGLSIDDLQTYLEDRLAELDAKHPEPTAEVEEKWLEISIVLTPIIRKRMMIHWAERKFAIKKRIWRSWSQCKSCRRKKLQSWWLNGQEYFQEIQEKLWKGIKVILLPKLWIGSHSHVTVQNSHMHPKLHVIVQNNHMFPKSMWLFKPKKGMWVINMMGCMWLKVHVIVLNSHVHFNGCVQLFWTATMMHLTSNCLGFG